MASSGKKGKKNKGTVFSLQSFLSDGDTPAGTTQVSKKIRNVDGDDSDDGSNSLPLVYQLPSAPRANRIFDDETIPHKPPFLAYVANLPFDIVEEDIHSFFAPIPLVTLRLPREDGETGRVRGFGYIEFETRDDLIHVLSLPDPSIKGRRIRIDLSNEHDQQNSRQKSNKRGFDGFSNSGENRDSTNWRRDNQSQDFGGGYDRGFDRGGDRGNRERKPLSEDTGAPGSWRMGSRPLSSDPSPRIDRDKYRDVNRTNDRERTSNDNEQSMEERPKLNLKPRTLPLPEIIQIPDSEISVDNVTQDVKLPKSVGVSKENVFGSAKPVDTASRELEIEERLAEARRQEKLQHELDKTELTEKLGDVQLEKKEKDTTNSAISWRRKTDVEPTESVRKHSSDRSGFSKQDDEDENQESDINKSNKKYEKPENGAKSRDSKPKEDTKIKRDVKLDRTLPKSTLQAEPVLQSSNKYSGLDDEASE